MLNYFHRPQTRRKGKDALNTLKVILEITKEALDGMSIPGPKAAVGALLSVITTLEVS